MVALLAAFCSCGDHRPTAAEAEAAVRELEALEVAAILAKDLNELDSIWSPGFTVNSPLLHGLVPRERVLDMARHDVISYTTFERHIEHVTVLGDVVVTMGAEVLVPQGNHPHAGQTVRRRFTNVWAYRDGKWQETNRHAHVVPPNATAP